MENITNLEEIIIPEDMTVDLNDPQADNADDEPKTFMGTRTPLITNNATQVIDDNDTQTIDDDAETQFVTSEELEISKEDTILPPPPAPYTAEPNHEKIEDLPVKEGKKPLHKISRLSKSPISKRYRTVSKKCNGSFTNSQQLLGNIVQLLESQFSCSISCKKLRRRSLVSIRSNVPSPLYNGVKFE
ncbi:uncharacterized protein LOC110855338 [Folsomia candida]|uniref:uncharacterized protein LOC110855338 n=1 Tax=Folsomia candida TaxID=158441 RepID=UPI000B90985B|nr:uncharacterized protein LOC110855338 [Folsomia candida]